MGPYKDLSKGLSSNILIYPNPASDKFNIILDRLETQTVRFELYNSIGQKIMEDEIIDNKAIVDVKSMSKGIYMIVIELNDKSTIRKKVIVK